MVIMVRLDLAFLALTLSIALSALPRETSAQMPWKSPHGIFELGPNAYTNPVVQGRRMQILWSDIQPVSETQFDWSTVDTQLANAQQYQKQFGLSVVILSAPPSWLTNTAGVETYQMPPKNGQTMSIVLPWNPIVQAKIINFVTQLCLRYDGVVDYIVMGGLGFSTESYLPDPADIGLNMTLSEAVAAWTTSSNTIIDAHATHLFSTPCIMAAGIPFSGTEAKTALSTVVDRAAAIYGQRFGIMSWTLNANSNTALLPNALIAQYSPTNPVGHQFLCPAAGNDNGKTLDGTLEETLDAGIALGAQWIEAYGEDALNPDYAAAFQNATAAMAPPPPPPDTTLTPTPTPSPSPGATPTPPPDPTPPPVYLSNVSTRVKVRNNDQVMIGGFIISGTSNKRVVIRALGPSLATPGVKDVLADPTLELRNSAGTLLAQNDNYVTPLPADIVASGLTPSNPAESLIAITLPPGSYTAILQGANGTTGVALCELYDTDPTSSRISNISTRGEVGTEDDAMIGGFIVGGSDSIKVLVRAMGPSLSRNGVQAALADPVLELRDAEGSLIFLNDNWRKDQEQQIVDSAIPPSDEKESAIIATLPPGAYTALVRSAGTTTGIALVEVYNLQSN